MLQGLTTHEATVKLEKFGPNSFQKQKHFSTTKVFFSQFSSPLIAILLIAAVITGVLREVADTVIILLAVVVNAVLGFFQEFKAQNALQALSQVLSRQARVMRDGNIVVLTTDQLVSGDIVYIEAGEQVPADGVFLEAKDITMNQSVLTGESLPVVKVAVRGDGESENKKLAMTSSQDEQAKHFGYMGTTCATGKGVMQILETGERTALGQISASLRTTYEVETPLQQQLKQFGKRLTILVVCMAVVIFLVGILSGRPLVEMFTLSVAMAVSSIPEGLVISLTVILAIGMQRILKRKALVRKLVAAETLGSVSVICTDKTGTLTTGELSVILIDSEQKEMMQRLAQVVTIGSDPLEVAIRNWSETHAKKLVQPEILDEVPFSSDRKFSVRMTEKEMVVLGAPDVLLRMCRKVDQKEIEKAIRIFTTQGYRVVGLATRTLKKGENRIILSDLHQLDWVGCFVFSDQVRTGIIPVLKQARSAGIQIKVITGDYAETAKSILEQLDIPLHSDQIMVGSDFKILSRQQIEERIAKTVLFARTTPDQKLMIVEILQKMGHVVAMTGDGVNDAPALKRADIGIVVNNASDVSKETADMVLLDNNFATIVAAVEEGRGIFENLRKVLLYLLSDSFSEIILVMGSVLLGLPLPLTAAQILWINLVDDSLPNLALTIDPNGTELLQDPPRKREVSLIDREMYVLIGLISLMTGLTVLGSFFWSYSVTGNVQDARLLAFAILGFDSLIYVFSSRTLRKPIWSEGFFKNKWLLMAVFVGACFQLSAFYVPFLQNFFQTRPLTGLEWCIVLSACSAVIFVIETVKWLWSGKTPQRLD